MTRHLSVTITEMQARTIVNLMEDSNDCIIPMSSSDIRAVRALARNLRQAVSRLEREDDEMANLDEIDNDGEAS